jgi:hypothetical protein
MPTSIVSIEFPMWNFSDVDLWALIIIWPSQKIFNNSYVPHLRKQQISVFRYLSTHPPTHPSIHSSIYIYISIYIYYLLISIVICYMMYIKISQYVYSSSRLLSVTAAFKAAFAKRSQVLKSEDLSLRSGGSPGDHRVPAMDVSTKRCSDLRD